MRKRRRVGNNKERDRGKESERDGERKIVGEKGKVKKEEWNRSEILRPNFAQLLAQILQQQIWRVAN